MTEGGWVYILSNRYRGGIYVGVSADLVRRIWQHREGLGSQYVANKGLDRLVYTERHDDIRLAIVREKRIKRWRREWKFALIEARNPDWRDLRAGSFGNMDDP